MREECKAKTAHLAAIAAKDCAIVSISSKGSDVVLHTESAKCREKELQTLNGEQGQNASRNLQRRQAEIVARNQMQDKLRREEKQQKYQELERQRLAEELRFEELRKEREAERDAQHRHDAEAEEAFSPEVAPERTLTKRTSREEVQRRLSSLRSQLEEADFEATPEKSSASFSGIPASRKTVTFFESASSVREDDESTAAVVSMSLKVMDISRPSYWSKGQMIIRKRSTMFGDEFDEYVDGLIEEDIGGECKSIDVPEGQVHLQVSPAAAPPTVRVNGGRGPEAARRPSVQSDMSDTSSMSFMRDMSVLARMSDAVSAAGAESNSD